MSLMLTAAEVRRFYSRIDRSGDCWTWTGELNNQGYGRFTVYRNGRRVRLLAHRVAYLLEAGALPSRLVIRHKCDNPPCARRDHLTTGTQAENIRDAATRGRMNVSGLEQCRADRETRLQARIAAGIKTCSGCRITKALSEFSRNRTTRDGRQGECKFCASARAAALRAKHARLAARRGVA